MARIFLLASVIFVFFVSPVFGQERMPDEIGIRERLGQNLPLDLTFSDERGSAVRLRELIDKPTILTLVYYHCSHICPQMLLGLSEVFAQLETMPGRDYRVITISLDETDTPEDARNQKINYIKAINRPFPDDSWNFLTGNGENIRKLAEAIGITFRKEVHGFIHPEVVIFISPQGRIMRYLYVSKISYGVGYPVNFSPVDFSTALIDTSKGVAKAGVRRAPLLCFPHEPGQQKKFFKILAILGAITLLLMASLFIYLSLTSKRTSAHKD